MSGGGITGASKGGFTHVTGGGGAYDDTALVAADVTLTNGLAAAVAVNVTQTSDIATINATRWIEAGGTITATSATKINETTAIMSPASGTAAYTGLQASGTWSPSGGTPTYRLIDLAFTANMSGGVATGWTGIYLDVTNTASAGTRRLIDLRVGGTTLFNVDHSGNLTIPSTAFIQTGQIYNTAGANFAILSTGYHLASNRQVAWSSSTSPGVGTDDVGLARSAAGVAKVTNGTTGLGSLWTSDIEIDGALNHDGTTVGFYTVTPIARAVVPTGSTLDQLITAMQNLGLISQT